MIKIDIFFYWIVKLKKNNFNKKKNNGDQIGKNNIP
jgi:hypothetical protein